MKVEADMKRHWSVRWKRLRQRSTSESGITLIEGMAGMIILSVGLLALLPMATLSVSTNQLSRDTADASQLLQNQIEKLRTMAVLTDGSATDPETGMYTHWWLETDPDGLQKVHVEVTWYSDLGVSRMQRATTFLYRSGDELIH
jgi:Tfp pilus assembly protein PilV